MNRLARLVVLIAVGVFCFLMILFFNSKADSGHYWIGDDTPSALTGVFDKAGDFFKEKINNVREGGDGTGDTTGVVDKLLESEDAVVSGANVILDAAGGVIDSAGDYMQKAGGIFASAGDLLAEAAKVLKETYPDLHINLPDSNTANASSPSPASLYSDAPGMTVEFIDVGQADCILVYTGQDAMLIDAGNNEDGPLVVDYLRSLGITHLDYVIGTHAHEDHIGGLDDVIQAFDVDTIILPVTPTNTYTYTDVLDTAYASPSDTLYASEDASFTLGTASFSIVACNPVEDATNLNESSIVIRLDYDDASFLFTGDAEKANEADILARAENIDCDVLKVGHHGSYTSSSSEFLSAVSPAISVISCGEDNEYGHPHEVTMQALDEANTAIFRTDLSGTIRINTDGKEYDVTTFMTNTDGAVQ